MFTIHNDTVKFYEIQVHLVFKIKPFISLGNILRYLINGFQYPTMNKLQLTHLLCIYWKNLLLFIKSTWNFQWIDEKYLIYIRN